MLVSSHLMSEMSQTADHLIVIGKGKLIADLPIAELIASSSRASVLVRTPQTPELQRLAGDVDQRLGRRHADQLALQHLHTIASCFLADALENERHRRARGIEQVHRHLHHLRVGSSETTCLDGGQATAGFTNGARDGSRNASVTAHTPATAPEASAQRKLQSITSTAHLARKRK